eukprot:1148166-Alexandrium_andersonii.AAC.1
MPVHWPVRGVLVAPASAAPSRPGCHPRASAPCSPCRPPSGLRRPRAVPRPGPGSFLPRFPLR